MGPQHFQYPLVSVHANKTKKLYKVFIKYYNLPANFLLACFLTLMPALVEGIFFSSWDARRQV